MNRTFASALRAPISFVSGQHEALTALRRDLHAHPELGFEEHRTAALVCERLKQWGVELHTGIGRTGVVGVLQGATNRSGKSIGLRADMDALPMQEGNDFAYRSTRSGLMHGCGHDGHTTMLLGAAQYLAATRRFDGTVYLIFQPGEEGFGGAQEMINDGLFQRFPANEVYALHNWPALPSGHIGLNCGPMMAAADRVEITIRGRGGHGAHPHLTVDPVVVAAHIVASVQTIVSRNVSPLEPAVVSICAIAAGNVNAMSVVPSEVKMVGTVRAFQHRIQDLIETRLTELVQNTARAFGAEGEVKYERKYPPTINHAPQYEFAADVAESLVGKERVERNLPPSMGSEDFAFMLQVKPGCYLRLGQGGAESGCFLHNSRYDFNDAVIPLGAGLLAGLAEQRMPPADAVA